MRFKFHGDVSLLGIGSLAQCTSCDPGKYCPSPSATSPVANCTAGYYCVLNATTAQPVDGVTGDICPTGHYCPEGFGEPFPCEDGTYAGTTGMAVCDECTAGHYCVPGVSDVTPEACPIGFYCPAGTGHIWTPCPIGTFSAATGLSAVSQCTDCTGMYGKTLYCV